VEGMALSAILGAITATMAIVGTLLTLGKNVLTKKEHTEICVSNQAPIKKDIEHLKEGQGRVESKVERVESKVEEVLKEVLKIAYKLNGGK